MHLSILTFLLPFLPVLALSLSLEGESLDNFNRLTADLSDEEVAELYESRVNTFVVRATNSSAPSEQAKNNTAAAAARNPLHCGSWVYGCSRAEGACNNACWYINFVSGGSYRATYDPDQSANRNRRQSGCQTNDGSVCNLMPTSQVWKDEPGLLPQNLNCDEFPMAAMRQPNFDGQSIRNSLRCINPSENSSGGSKLKNFINDIGGGRQKRNPACRGKLIKGDTFDVEFNYDGADVSKLAYCKHGNNQPKKDTDFNEFYMSFLDGTGNIHFPLGELSSNRYSWAFNEVQLQQCKLVVHRARRDNGDFYRGSVIDNSGDEVATGSGLLTRDNSHITLTASDPGQRFFPTEVTRLGRMGSSGRSSDVGFTYAPGVFNRPEVFFTWTTATSGADNRFHERQPDNVVRGGYCSRPPIKRDNEGVPRQTITCYFPCVAS